MIRRHRKVSGIKKRVLQNVLDYEMLDLDYKIRPTLICAIKKKGGVSAITLERKFDFVLTCFMLGVL